MTLTLLLQLQVSPRRQKTMCYVVSFGTCSAFEDSAAHGCGSGPLSSHQIDKGRGASFKAEQVHLAIKLMNPNPLQSQTVYILQDRPLARRPSATLASPCPAHMTRTSGQLLFNHNFSAFFVLITLLMLLLLLTPFVQAKNTSICGRLERRPHSALP